jgi:RNA polymerase sigma-70 factor (ECF subfamily)
MINWFKKNVVQRLSEEQLIKKVQQGDKEAFGELYLIYLDRIYRYIFFRVNLDKATAEDLSESVFIKAMQHIGTFTTEKGNFQAWLYRIAHNTVIDHYKSYKQTTSLQEHTVSHDQIETLEEALDIKNQIENVTKAMKHLTDEQREVIILRFIEDLPPRQIALIVDKHEDAVRAIQYRALQTLRKQLQ